MTERPPWRGGCPPGLQRRKPKHAPNSWMIRIIDAVLASGVEDSDHPLAPRVYFFRSGRHVKVGYTTRLHERLSALAHSNPAHCELMGSLPGGRETEVAVHKLLSKYHHRGEWFRLTPALDRGIRKIFEECHRCQSNS